MVNCEKRKLEVLEYSTQLPKFHLITSLNSFRNKLSAHLAHVMLWFSIKKDFPYKNSTHINSTRNTCCSFFVTLLEKLKKVLRCCYKAVIMPQIHNHIVVWRYDRRRYNSFFFLRFLFEPICLLYINDFLMVSNHGVFRILSSIVFATVKSQREEKQKKYDFAKIFYIFIFFKLFINTFRVRLLFC